MKKIMRVKNKATLLLISAILVLCIGFIIAGCGTSPQLKAPETNNGAFAQDGTDCPSAPCITAFSNAGGVLETISGKEITLEAWIKPKATSTTSSALKRLTGSGAALKVNFDTGTLVKPRFEIVRVVASASGSGTPPTSTASYIVIGDSIDTSTPVWTHIAGVLTNKDHSAVAGHPACADATPIGADPHVADGSALNDPWHLDFYQGGTLVSCGVTYGSTTVATDNDPTFAADAYTLEPVDNSAAITYTDGIIDEARIWNVDRSAFISECMNAELGLTGNCSRLNNLVLYSRFNNGEGHFVTDLSGVMGNGGREYADPLNSGEFLDWITGWTTDIPPITAAE